MVRWKNSWSTQNSLNAIKRSNQLIVHFPAEKNVEHIVNIFQKWAH